MSNDESNSCISNLELGTPELTHNTQHTRRFKTSFAIGRRTRGVTKLNLYCETYAILCTHIRFSAVQFSLLKTAYIT